MSDSHHHEEGEMDRLGSYLFDLRVRAVAPHISGKLLDIGCGTNRLVKQYQGEGIGVDVYQFGGADVIVEDTSNLPFADASFDTVTLLATLNHIHNRGEVLHEIFRVLSPGGILLVTMIPPRLSRVWHKIREPWDRDQKERGMHEHEVFGFTRREIRSLLLSAGYQVVQQSSFMCGVNTLTIARKS